MGRIREWLTALIPRDFSSWLLQSYRRPLGFFLGLGVPPLVVIMAAAYQLNVTLWRRETLHNLGVTARLASQIVHETLQETLRLEQLLASQPGFVDDVERRDRARLTTQLQEVIRFTPRIDLAIVATTDGDVVAASPDSPDLPGRNVAHDEPFLGAQHGGWHPYVSAVYLREGPEIEKVVSVVSPITQGDRVIGLLLLQHRVEEIKAWIQKIRVQPSGFLYVVDHHDQLVVYPFQVLPGKPKVVSAWPPVACALPMDGTSFRFRDERSHRLWLAGVDPVGTIGWRVVAVQPEHEALKTLRQVFWLLGILIAVLLVAVGALSLRWAQLHEFSLQLTRQNAKLLKQFQQRRLFEQDSESDNPTMGPGT